MSAEKCDEITFGASIKKKKMPTAVSTTARFILITAKTALKAKLIHAKIVGISPLASLCICSLTDDKSPFVVPANTFGMIKNNKIINPIWHRIKRCFSIKWQNVFLMAIDCRNMMMDSCR